MLHFELINKEWIVSRTARIVYRSAAIASLGIFIPLTIFILNLDRDMAHPLRLLLKPLLFLGVVGMALTGLGMEYFLFRFDNSHALKQIFWFCALLLPPIGPALYCFLVYSGSDVVKNCVAVPTGISGLPT
jgi:hypothetical protein